MKCIREHRATALTLAAASVLLTGCKREQPAPDTQTPVLKTESTTPASPKAPLFKKAEIADWCPEHGVPESICTRCNASLIDAFKKKGDWCGAHGLPESQCLQCHPELKSKLEAMKPAQG